LLSFSFGLLTHPHFYFSFCTINCHPRH
jgi:hypothetical protein